jgi:hypothetical protein
VKASPTESEELVLITSLVTHLKRCPELLTLFAHRPNPGDASHSNSLASSRASSIADLSTEIAKMMERSVDLKLCLFKPSLHEQRKQIRFFKWTSFLTGGYFFDVRVNQPLMSFILPNIHNNNTKSQATALQYINS